MDNLKKVDSKFKETISNLKDGFHKKKNNSK